MKANTEKLSVTNSTLSVRPSRLTSVSRSRICSTCTSLAWISVAWAVVFTASLAITLSFSGRCTTLTSPASSAPSPSEIWFRRKVTFTVMVSPSGWNSTFRPVGLPSASFSSTIKAKSYSRVFSAVYSSCSPRSFSASM